MDFSSHTRKRDSYAADEDLVETFAFDYKKELRADEPEKKELSLDEPEEEVVFLTYNEKMLENEESRPAEAKIEELNIDELNIDDDEKAVNSPLVLTTFDQIGISGTTAEIERAQPKRNSRYNRIFSSVRKGEYIETISIPGWHVASDVVYYEVVVSNNKLCWNCWIRFNSFTILHLLLKDLLKNLTSEKSKVHLPPFPEKQSKILTDHFSEEFIENRRALLENYLRKINSDNTLRYAEDFMSFLLPPQEPLENTSGRNSPHVAFPTDSLSSLVESDGAVPSALDEFTKNAKSASNSPVILKRSRYRFTDREKKLMLFVSDTDEITGVSIKSATILQDQIGRSGLSPHVIYHIHVRNTNKSKEFNVWTVMKRFHEFVNFDGQLRALLSVSNPTAVQQLPKPPPKRNKSWTNHLNPVFIEKRRILLEVYLRRLIRFPPFRRHPLTLKFLGVDSDISKRSICSSMIYSI